MTKEQREAKAEEDRKAAEMLGRCNKMLASCRTFGRERILLRGRLLKRRNLPLRKRRFCQMEEEIVILHVGRTYTQLNRLKAPGNGR